MALYDGQGGELNQLPNNAVVSADNEKIQGMEHEHNWKATVTQNAKQKKKCGMSRDNGELDETVPEHQTNMTSEHYNNNRNKKLCPVISGVALLIFWNMGISLLFTSSRSR